MADKKTQREKFEEAASELETDDSEESFDAMVKKIAKAPLKEGAKEMPPKQRR